MSRKNTRGWDTKVENYLSLDSCKGRQSNLGGMLSESVRSILTSAALLCFCVGMFPKIIVSTFSGLLIGLAIV